MTFPFHTNKMAGRHPATIEAYILAAPPDGQPILNRLDALLQTIAPQAERTIKWGAAFFVEPRFLFAFSAHKAHLNFTPMADALEAFGEDLKPHTTTKGSLQVRYIDPLPEDLIRRIAEHRLRVVSQREDASFW